MDGWNTSFLLEWPIFRGYVSFREGNDYGFSHCEKPGSLGRPPLNRNKVMLWGMDVSPCGDPTCRNFGYLHLGGQKKNKKNGMAENTNVLGRMMHVPRNITRKILF